MYWAIVVDGKIVYIPDEIYDETTKEVTVLNSYSEHIEHGHKPVKFNRPTYNPRTQMLIYKGFIETNIDIQIQYEIVNLNLTLGLENILNEEINLD